MAADVHALSGAYVVDAIEPADRIRFEAHLAACPSCQTEVALLQDTAVVMTSVTAAHPPVGLRQRLLAMIHMTPQLRPRPVAPVAHTAGRGRFGWLLAAAAAVAVLGVGATVVLDRDTGPVVAGPVTARTVVDAPDARVREIELDEGEFRVASSRRLGLLAVAAEMPELRRGQVYQLWVITDSARSLAVLEGGHGVATTPDHGRLAVTVEPAGGSPQPTTVPVFVLDVSHVTA
jgi:anti-sigma-K factor RskA